MSFHCVWVSETEVVRSSPFLGDLPLPQSSLKAFTFAAVVRTMGVEPGFWFHDLAATVQIDGQ